MDDDLSTVLRWYAAVGREYVSVLRWHKTVGYARHHRVSVVMDERPCLRFIGDAVDIEYIDGTGAVDGVPMTDEQLRDVRELLIKTASDAHDAIYGHSTLAVVI